MFAGSSITGIETLDRMAELLPPDERRELQQSVERGYLSTRPEQRELQRLWTLWCMKTQCADIRVETHGPTAAVTMHLGPCQSTLSADGRNAIRRAFERASTQVRFYQTNNWCKHPQVPSAALIELTASLYEIAQLDGVPFTA
jgi:hypothetical protein